MSPHDTPETPDRPPSDVENAMAANARSRDRQGKAEDKARRDRHVGMMGDGTEEQNLGQPGYPAARIGQSEVEAAFGSPVAPEARSISDTRQDSSDDDRAADEGMGEPRNPSRGPSARP
jgi:hypothetical protein